MRLLILFLIFPLYTNAQIKAYPIDSWHSNIQFKVKFSGLIPVKGQFETFNGTILLNEEDMTKTSATILINTNSISTGVTMRDNHLKNEDFFDVEKYPKIAFSSKRTVDKDGHFVMIGILKMHDISKEIEIPIKLVHGEQLDVWENFRITLEGKFEVNRSDFNIGEGQPAIGEVVTIDFLMSARIFNTKTIALFNRPFGKIMIKAILEGSKEQALSEINKLKNNQDEDSTKASSFMHLYNYLKQKNHIKAAFQIAELFTEFHPKESEAYSLLGDAYFQNKSFKKAKMAFEKAIKYDAKNTMALEMLKLLN